MAAVIRQREIDGETVLFLGETTLVASKSEPGAWYEIRDNRCTCAGFHYRSTCRHLAPAKRAADLDRDLAVAVEAVPAPPVGVPTVRERVYGKQSATALLTRRDDLA